MKHPLPRIWHDGRIDVQLVGVGGTGSQILTGLGRLHVGLRALGHEGLCVTAWDPDRVSPSNIGRQLFAPGDIGAYKAAVLVQRVNCFFGLDWRAAPERWSGQINQTRPNVVISCVDSAAARRQIVGHLHGGDYLLDCGNAQQSGQVFLTGGGGRISEDLPGLRHWLPEIFDESIPEDNRPSCSLAEALESQDLFINQAMATWALHMLWSFVREGGLDICGYWINLAEGRVVPVPIPEQGTHQKGAAA